MGTLLTTDTGRLKTGRITILAFLSVLLTASLIFKASKPIDQIAVAVQHVFEPQKNPIPSVPEKIQESTMPQEVLAETVKNALEQLPLAPEISDALPDKAENNGPSEKVSEKIAKTATKNEAFEEERGLETVSVDDTGKRLDKTGLSKPSTLKPSAQDVRPETTLPLHETLEDKDLAESTSLKLDISKSIAKIYTAPPRELESPNADGKTTAAISQDGIHSVELKKNTLTVGKQEYLEIFRGWRNAGAGQANNGGQSVKKLSLRVENLRQVYGLFQMKPVAKTKGIFIDLETGTRISEKSLAQYSQTVFQVDDPWSKWNDALKAAGLRQMDIVDVRYYMYSFVRNALYSRAEKALQWSKEQGEADHLINHDDADVLGKAFVVQLDSGGKFGVFVPLSMTLKNGTITRISPACFKGEKDVDTLLAAGLL